MMMSTNGWIIVELEHGIVVRACTNEIQKWQWKSKFKPLALELDI